MLAVVGCRGKKKANEALADIDGLAALGEGVAIVVGGDIEKLASSRLVRRGIEAMLASDTELKTRVEAIAAECKLVPGENVNSFIIGIGEGPSDLLLALSGRFEENALTACVQKRLVDTGGRLTTVPVEGRTAYRADGGSGSEPVWFALGSPKTLILAGSQEWLARGLGKGPRLTSNAATNALIASAPTKRTIWAAGKVPEQIGAMLVDATGGAISAPPSMTAQVDFERGVQAQLTAQMVSEKDAKALEKLHKFQAPMIAAMAQAKGLGRLAAKLEVASAGKKLKIGLVANEAELSDLLATVDSGATEQQNPPSSEPNPAGEEGAKSHEGNTTPDGKAPLRR